MFWAQTVAGIILVGGVLCQIRMGLVPIPMGVATLALVFVWTVMALAVWLTANSRK